MYIYIQPCVSTTLKQNTEQCKFLKIHQNRTRIQRAGYITYTQLLLCKNSLGSATKGEVGEPLLLKRERIRQG